MVFPEFDPLAWQRADRSSAGSATSIDTHVSQEGKGFPGGLTNPVISGANYKDLGGKGGFQPSDFSANYCKPRSTRHQSKGDSSFWTFGLVRRVERQIIRTFFRREFGHL